MIPLELSLTNFLSYRHQVIVDMRSIHLACISGPNGAGKSTLLDAITWALFGQSRARSDDDLVHSAAGGDAAEVELTFDMEGTIYRVLRRKRPRKTAELEFQVKAAEDDGLPWVTLTEARIRETQASIERVLLMNYDVFVNASFFLQGKADEFTNRSPTRRKEILAEVLSVTKWDVLGKQASSERKQTESEAELTRRKLEEVNLELDEAGDRQARLSEALTQETAVRARLADKELLLQQARQIWAQIEQQKQQVQAQTAELSNLGREIERLKLRSSQLEAERQQFATIVSEADQIEADFAKWTAADEAFQKWQQLAAEVLMLQKEENPLQLRIATERSRLEQRHQGLDKQREAMLAAQVEQETIETDLQVARSRLAEMVKLSAGLVSKEVELHKLELDMERMAGERKQQEQELQRLQAEQKRIETAQAEVTSVERVLQVAQARAAELSAELAEVAKQSEELVGLLAERDHLSNELSKLEADAKKERDRIDELLLEIDGDCPLCGQPLTADHRDKVVRQLEADLQEKRDQYREKRDLENAHTVQLSRQGNLQSRRSQLQRELDAKQQQIMSANARTESINQQVSQWSESGSELRMAELERVLNAQASLAQSQSLAAEYRTQLKRKAQIDQEISSQQQSITRQESRLEQIARESTAWEKSGSIELRIVAEQLESKSFAQDEQAQLTAIQARIEALGYDAAQHTAVRQQRNLLDTAPEKYQSLRQAQAALHPRIEALAESTQQLAERVDRQTELTGQRNDVLRGLQGLETGAADRTVLEDEVIRLREELSLASQYVGATKQKVAVLDDRLKQKKLLLNEQQKLGLRVQQLKQLEEACGRNGVQALLIEHALPEIEERANSLLERLSGGAMRVTFETQRELKSRDALAETLEIHISDAAGERPYENYSGGEQFRVNFAVRLALSQALAHRSGAPLRTLVIDEGFGSQDPEGRQRLVEAINAIQSDFACILIITHIDELRDAFPARIEVTKTSSGSQVQVISGV